MDKDSRERQKCKLKMKFMSSWSLLSWIMMLQSLSTKSSSVVELLNLWRWCSVLEACAGFAMECNPIQDDVGNECQKICFNTLWKSFLNISWNHHFRKILNMINAYFELRNIAKCGVCCMSLSSFNIREISHFSMFYDATSTALKGLFVATLEELLWSLKAFRLLRSKKRDFVLLISLNSFV